MGSVKLPRVGRYKKQISAYSGIDFKRDGSIIPFSAAKNAYNVDFSSGALRKGYGVTSSSCVPDGAVRYWVYRYYSDKSNSYIDQYIYQYATGLLAYFDTTENDEVFVTGVGFQPLEVLNYRLNSKDVLLLSCKGRKLVTWDGSKLTEHEKSPDISSMALHYERLFVTSRTERTRVYFSKNLDPTDWDIGKDGGGFIELLDERGFLNKVVSFGSYLYIFREHGISRVTAYGDQSEFTVVNMYATSGQIYPSSITKCGNCIMFLASDGIYCFDGYECKRVLDNLFPRIEANDSCTGAYYQGKYFLSCRMHFNDDAVIADEVNTGAKINCLIVYDLSTGEYSLTRGLNIGFMNACSYEGKDFLMCCCNGRGCVIEEGKQWFTNALPSYWESGDTDLGAPNRVKTITEVAFSNSEDASDDGVELGVNVDGVWHKLNLTGRGMCATGMNLSGYRFSFSVKTESSAFNITPLSVKYNMYRR